MSSPSWLDALKARFLPTLNRRERRASGQRGRRLKVENLEDRRVLAFAVPPASYPVGDSPQAIVSADFNGGGLDLAVANYSSSTVSVLPGDGSGGFGPKADFGTGTNPRSLAVGDVSGDGKIDLITANAGGDVSILQGDGAGSFGAPVSIPLPDQYESTWGFAGYVAQSPHSVATGDFNGDGKLDLAVTGVASFIYTYYNNYYVDHAYVNVLISDGSGGFNPPVTTSLSSVTRYYWDSGTPLSYSIAVGRFNGDAIDDLAIAHYYSYLHVLQSNGSGGFSSSAYYHAGYYPYTVAAGDVNGDSRPDLVTANNDGNNVSVLLANSLGSFDTAQAYPAGSQPRSLAMAKLNGDDFLDIAVANADNGTVSVLLGTGAGTFTLPLTAAVGSSPLGVAVGNFDGSGGSDVASANSGSDNVTVLLNNGIWPALDAPSISVNNASVAEGNTGTTAMEFTVTLSAAPTQTVTVHYATVDSNALAGSDYVAASGTLTFNPGDPLSQKVDVLVNGDRVVEYSEYLYLRLSEPTNAFLNRATGLGNIIDDEPRVSIDYGPVYVTEGNTGTTDAKFTVRLSAPYDVDVTVNLSAVEGDTDLWFGDWYWGYYGPYPPATLNTDFHDSAQTITFHPGDPLTKEITVLINGDTDVELSEHFFVNLDNLNYGEITGPQAVGIIVDDEPRASISGAGTVGEGAGTMTFTITLSNPSLDIVTVDYATAAYGSATAGSDYVAKVGTATFNPGVVTQYVTVTILDDRTAEYDEYLYVNLTGATGAVLQWPMENYGYIQDNEPRLSINNASITEGNSGTKQLTFTVTLSLAYDEPVTVNFATQNDSATAGSDFQAKSGTLTFNPGQPLTQTITITINGDKQKEPDEYFYVVLSGASSNALISDAYGLGTILTDDPGKGPGKGPGKP